MDRFGRLSDILKSIILFCLLSLFMVSRSFAAITGSVSSFMLGVSDKDYNIAFAALDPAKVSVLDVSQNLYPNFSLNIYNELMNSSVSTTSNYIVEFHIALKKQDSFISPTIICEDTFRFKMVYTDNYCDNNQNSQDYTDNYSVYKSRGNNGFTEVLKCVSKEKAVKEMVRFYGEPICSAGVIADALQQNDYPIFVTVEVSDNLGVIDIISNDNFEFKSPKYSVEIIDDITPPNRPTSADVTIYPGVKNFDISVVVADDTTIKNVLIYDTTDINNRFYITDFKDKKIDGNDSYWFPMLNPTGFQVFQKAINATPGKRKITVDVVDVKDNVTSITKEVCIHTGVSCTPIETIHITDVQITPSVPEVNKPYEVSGKVVTDLTTKTPVDGASVTAILEYFDTNGNVIEIGSLGTQQTGADGTFTFQGIPQPTMKNYNVSIYAEYKCECSSTTAGSAVGFTIFDPAEGHDLKIIDFVLSKSSVSPGGNITLTALIKNEGNYVETDIPVVLEILGPSGNIIDSYSEVWQSLNLNTAARKISAMLHTDSNITGQYKARVRVDIPDEFPGDNTKVQSFYVGTVPSYDEYKEQTPVSIQDGSSKTVGTMNNYSIVVNETYKGKASITVKVGNQSYTKIVNESAWAFFDNNKLLLRIDICDYSNNETWITPFEATTGKVDITPTQLHAEAGSWATFRVQTDNSDRDPQINIRNVTGSQGTIVDRWTRVTENFSADNTDYDLKFKIPLNATIKTYNFWVGVQVPDDYIQKLTLIVEPPHDLELKSLATADGLLNYKEGDIITFNVTVSNNNGYDDYNALVELSITGPNNYYIIQEQSVSLLKNEMKTLSFEWYTAGTEGGIYDVTATVLSSYTDRKSGNNSQALSIPLTPDTPPIADAGIDQQVQVGETVILDGSGSNDPDGNTLTYIWSISSKPAGSNSVLSGQNTSAPSFKADRTGDYIIQLVVSDGIKQSIPDAVTITAIDTLSPSVPYPLTATVISSDQIDLSWEGSDDNSGVIAGYNIYRDGVKTATTVGLVYSDTGLSADTEYCYEVTAFDMAGNESGKSNRVCVKTLALLPSVLIDPANYSFGDITLNNSSTRQFTISNTGTADLVVSSIAIMGTDASEFTLATGGSSPCQSLTPTIAPGGSCTIEVTFAPVTEGAKSATLHIVSNASNTPALDVPLSGTGVLQQFTLQVTKHGTGTGSVASTDGSIDCGTTCSAQFSSGTSVRLTASEGAGSTFTGWGGDCSVCGTSKSCDVTMDGNKICTAGFDQSGSVITFPDHALEQCVRDTIGKQTGDIMLSDVEGVTDLDCSNRGITDITGLEYFTSLQNLYLSGNHITDINALGNLTNLQGLELRGNQISDITVFANMTNLQLLDLGGNQINDINALKNLTNLYELNLSGNQINDINALDSLTNLMLLYLGGNQISDLNPLANLVSLTSLIISENRISDLQPLVNLVWLTNLYLAGNCITDFTPVDHVPNVYGKDQQRSNCGQGFSFDVSPSSHDFGSVEVKQSVVQEFTISNTGTVDITVSSITISGNNASEFSVVAGGTNPCPDLTPNLAPGENCTIEVTFTPLSVGQKNATLEVHADSALSGGVMNVSLVGAGVYLHGLDVWHYRNSNTIENLNDIVYGNNIFVVVGDKGTILTSPDGITWTQRNSGTTDNLMGVSFQNNTFFALGENGLMLTSIDGINWTMHNLDSTTLYDIIFVNNQFVLAGWDYIAVSSDLVNWTKSSESSPSAYTISYGNNVFVYGGEHGGMNYSSDGLTWGDTIVTDCYIGKVLFVNNGFYSVGCSSSPFRGVGYYSDDGVVWNELRGLNQDGITNSDIAYGDGIFVVTGSYGALKVSSDGRNWTSRNTGEASSWVYAIAFGNSTFVIVGENGIILQSDPVGADGDKNGLVAYYPFNGDATDASGNGNDLTPYGPVLTTDRFGNPDSAYLFDGTDDYMETSILETDFGRFSISYWFQTSDQGRNTAVQMAEHKSDGNYAFVRSDIGINSAGAVRVWAQENTNTKQSIRTNDSFADGKWHHVVVTKSGDLVNDLSIYIDGKLVSNITNVRTAQVTNLRESIIYIGSNVSFDGLQKNRYFNGKIDDVRIYNRALSGAEVQALYTEGNSLRSGLVAYYPFEGDASDQSGNGNDGVENGGVTYGTGVVGQALSLNGQDAYVDVQDSLALDVYDNLSVLAWIKTNKVKGTIVSKTTSTKSTGENTGWNFRLTDSNNITGELGAFFRTGGSDPTINIGTNTSVNDNNWHLVGFTRDKTTGEIRFYVDGSMVYSESRAFSIAPNNAPLTIGWNSTHLYPAGLFEGMIDELRIYNRVLAVSEIQALYNEGNANQTTYLLTIDTMGTGAGTVTSTDNPQTINCGTDCTDTYAYGTQITLSAQEDTNSTFTVWGGDCSSCSTNTDCTLTMDSDRTCTATFDLKQYSITTTVNPTAGGSISCSPNPVDHGSTSTCNITVNTGYTLQSVSGCGGTWDGTTTYATGAITGACTVDVIFSLKQYTITATASGNGTGTVRTDVGGINYSYPGTSTASSSPIDHGSSVTITASAGTGSTASFNGTCQAAGGVEAGNGTSTSTCTFTSLDGDKTVTATFTLNQYSITTTVSPTAGGSVSCSPNPVDHGSTSTCDITVNTGYTLQSVSGCGGMWNGTTTYTTGAVSGACTVDVVFSINLVVQKTGNGSGNVYSEDIPQTINCGADCSDTYGEGTHVRLIAQADPGSEFKGWGGDCAGCGVSTSCDVTMNSEKRCTASFDVSASSLDSGLVAYYPFNGDATDASGKGHDGISNGAVLTQDRFGNPDSAYYFDGSSSIEIQDNIFDSASLPDAVTIAVWAKRDATADGTRQAIIGLDYDWNDESNYTTDNEHSGIVMSFDVWSNEFDAAIDGYKPFVIGTDQGIKAHGSVSGESQWHFYVLTVQNNGEIVLYIDGQEQSRQSFAGKTLHFDGTDIDWIGNARPGGADPRYNGYDPNLRDCCWMFQGAIDDVRIYNRVLTVAEIQALYNEGNNFGNGLVAYYPFDGDATDASGNGYNLTPYGPVLTTDRFGNPDSAYLFDGVDDYMRGLMQETDLSLFTISYWFATDSTAAETVIKLNNDSLSVGNTFIRSDIGVYDIGQVRAWIQKDTGGTVDQQSKYVLSDLADNKWHHVVITRQGTTASDINIYIDGVLARSTTYLKDSITGSLPESIILIGVNNSPPYDGSTTSFNRYFNGKLDDIRIYNKVLSAMEIQALYNEESGNMNTRWLNVIVSGSGSGGVTSSPAGINCGSLCTAEFNYGEAVTLTANADTGSTASFGGTCQQAGGTEAGNGTSTATCTFSSLDVNNTVTATFTLKQYPITTTVTPTAGGSVSCNPNPVDHGSTSTCNITVNTGYTLQSVGGSCGGTWDGTTTYTTGAITGACTVDVTFSINRYDLTVQKTGSGTGTVTSTDNPQTINCGTDCSDTYDFGTPVTLFAQPDTDSAFTGWDADSDCGSCGTNTLCTVTIDDAKTCTAVFETIHTVTVNTTGTGTGSVTRVPDQQYYAKNSTVTLTANADTNSVFTGWGGDCGSCGTNTDCTLTVTDEMTCTAMFLAKSQSCSFIVSNPEEFQAALNVAKGNSQDDTICVNGGTYNIASTLVYDPTDENYALTIVGDNTTQEVILDGGADGQGNGVQIMKIDVCGWDSNINQCTIVSDNAHITIENITFQNGYNSTGNGGGLYVMTGASDITLVNNVFAGNSAESFSGGGFYAETVSGTITVTNNTLTSNSAGYGGGGFVWLNDNTATADIYNNIIWSNTASAGRFDGDDIYVESDGDNDNTGATVNLYNNDLSCPLDIDGLPLTGRCFWVTGMDAYSFGANISDDPLFDSLGYSLRNVSPCIDNGDNNAPALPVSDLRGINRISGGTVDMGAYEVPYVTLTTQVNTTGTATGTVQKTPDQSEYLAGTDVTLEALPGNGSAFSGWGGDCSACGSNPVCTITMGDTDMTCTAQFDEIIFGITSPNGGEEVASGGNYTISWTELTGAVKYDLEYSIDDGSTWRTIATGVTGTSYDWQVPAVAGNKRKCLVRVTAYDSNGTQIGQDASDAWFTIWVVKITSPNGGDTFSRGDTVPITWQINATKTPVTKIVLKYHQVGVPGWSLITVIKNGSARSYDWTIPPTLPDGKYRIKINLFDANKKRRGGDRTDGVISISGGVVCTDNDGDGFYAQAGCGTQVDCNDNNVNINPGATEICGDNIDNNCDGQVDEGCSAGNIDNTACTATGGAVEIPFGSGNGQPPTVSFNPGEYRYFYTQIPSTCTGEARIYLSGTPYTNGEMLARKSVNNTAPCPEYNDLYGYLSFYGYGWGPVTRTYSWFYDFFNFTSSGSEVVRVVSSQINEPIQDTYYVLVLNNSRYAGQITLSAYCYSP